MELIRQDRLSVVSLFSGRFDDARGLCVFYSNKLGPGGHQSFQYCQLGFLHRQFYFSGGGGGSGGDDHLTLLYL